MSLIISAHGTHGLRDGKHVCHATGCPWVYSGSGYPSSQTVSEHVGEVLSAAGFGLVSDATLQATDLIRDLIDPDDCSFDHHGGCQAHGYLSLQPGEMCPQLEAKAWVHNQDAAALRGEDAHD